MPLPRALRKIGHGAGYGSGGVIRGCGSEGCQRSLVSPTYSIFGRSQIVLQASAMQQTSITQTTANSSHIL
jgi:hypothetical protein